MKKSVIKVNQKLYWDGRKDNVQVTVVDTSLEGNNIAIIDGGICHIVNADNLAEIPFINQNVVLADKPVALADKLIANTKPSIKISYDEDVHSLFILIDNKTTICIPRVREEVKDAVGISYKNDEDSYNKEIGNALALYRSTAGEMKAKDAEEDEFDRLFKSYFGE